MLLVNLSQNNAWIFIKEINTSQVYLGSWYGAIETGIGLDLLESKGTVGLWLSAI